MISHAPRDLDHLLDVLAPSLVEEGGEVHHEAAALAAYLGEPQAVGLDLLDGGRGEQRAGDIALDALRTSEHLLREKRVGAALEMNEARPLGDLLEVVQARVVLALREDPHQQTLLHQTEESRLSVGQ